MPRGTLVVEGEVAQGIFQREILLLLQNLLLLLHDLHGDLLLLLEDLKLELLLLLLHLLQLCRIVRALHVHLSLLESLLLLEELLLLQQGELLSLELLQLLKSSEPVSRRLQHPDPMVRLLLRHQRRSKPGGGGSSSRSGVSAFSRRENWGRSARKVLLDHLNDTFLLRGQWPVCRFVAVRTPLLRSLEVRGRVLPTANKLGGLWENCLQFRLRCLQTSLLFVSIIVLPVSQDNARASIPLWLKQRGWQAVIQRAMGIVVRVVLR
mmetsp:Transcript_22685/g.52905  ORF Transcript_22685/g.52905 Transcript_22685/m.52905 type:complete len:265 (+) Transcript_22685:324-1118(+)